MNSVDVTDRGNDNWLIKYEKPAATDSQPEVAVLCIKRLSTFYGANVAGFLIPGANNVHVLSSMYILV